MEPVFTSLFIAPCSLLVCAPMTNQAFLWRELSADFSTWLSALIYACINLRNAFHHCAQRTKHRVIFFNWIRWSASFPSLLTWPTSESFWMSCHRPLIFFLRAISKSPMPFWNHCFNKQQIMRRRLQNKRASQLRPLNSGRKRQEFLWGHDPNDQSLTRFANAASLFSTHSICRGFQIPAAIPNTIDMISNFSNNPLSITSRKTTHRNLCAIQQEGKPNVALPLNNAP